ncbi:MAG TPA: HPr kinase/phosphatase C-terminal domain-containing protein [Alphaproteobacteria bacterium]|nr:HPr kinase/phosphatase C-terminal domain-containing protein [Alphaproteobacteria bacterium]
MSANLRVQGTCVALPIGGEFAAVLLRGAPGSGKSDLALRLIDGGALLVADDLTELAQHEGALIATAPQSIRGRMEVRGLGILKVPTLESAPLALIVDLVAPASVERLPQPAFEKIGEISLAKLALAPFEGSAPAKIRFALQALRGT